jgi:hypothetical protein
MHIIEFGRSYCNYLLKKITRKFILYFYEFYFIYFVFYMNCRNINNFMKILIEKSILEIGNC